MTLGELIAADKHLRGVCTTCERTREIDPATLKLGKDADLTDIAQRMRCRGCEEMTIRLDPIARPATDAECLEDPSVKAVLSAFPGARPTVKDLGGTAP